MIAKLCPINKDTNHFILTIYNHNYWHIANNFQRVSHDITDKYL